MAYETLIIDTGAIEGTSLCVPLMVTRPHTADGYTRAPYQAVATARFVVQRCVAPTEPVYPDQIIDIEIAYKWCELIIYDPHNEIERWKETVQPDGAEVWCLKYIGPACVERFLYLWRLTNFYLYLNGSLVQTIARAKTTPGSELTWTFRGTIEELLGRTVTTEPSVTLYWEIGYQIAACCNVEWWPWEASCRSYRDIYISEISISKTISIKYSEPPPPPQPPYLLFDLDYCAVSKTQVQPAETFKIKVRIVNQNEYSGKYIIGCICEAMYQKLGEGTISGNGTVDRTFNVTANKLAQRAITESQFLPFTITAENEKKKTDQWPAVIAVIVTEPEPVAQLSGRVTDKNTGVGIAAVSVAIGGRSTSTSSTGYYNFADLAPSTYTITFTKSGYWTETKTKRLVEGANTLDVAMAPTTEPEPGEGIPWHLIALGGGVAVGIILIASGVKGKK